MNESNSNTGAGARGFSQTYQGEVDDEDDFAQEINNLDLEWMFAQDLGFSESEDEEMDAWVNFFRNPRQGNMGFGGWAGGPKMPLRGRNGGPSGGKNNVDQRAAKKGAKRPASGQWTSANPRESSKPKAPKNQWQSAKPQKAERWQNASPQKAQQWKKADRFREQGKWTEKVDIGVGGTWHVNSRWNPSKYAVRGKPPGKAPSQHAYGQTKKYGPRKGQNQNGGDKSKQRWRK
jgi:hypothetical protein